MSVIGQKCTYNNPKHTDDLTLLIYFQAFVLKSYTKTSNIKLYKTRALKTACPGGTVA